MNLDDQLRDGKLLILVAGFAILSLGIFIGAALTRWIG